MKKQPRYARRLLHREAMRQRREARESAREQARVDRRLRWQGAKVDEALAGCRDT